MVFRCPNCEQKCTDVIAGSGVVQTKSDPRLLAPDQQQPGLMFTANCHSCVLQYVFLVPVISSTVQQIQLVEAKGNAAKLSTGEAQRAGLESVPS